MPRDVLFRMAAAVLTLSSLTLAQTPPAWTPTFQDAVAVLRGGDLPGATSRFESLWKSNPKDPQLAAWIGTALDSMNHHGEATGWYQRALVIQPHLESALNNLALNYAALGEFAKAAPLLREATQINPTNEQAFYNLGLVSLRLRRYREAAVSFRKAHELKPTASDPIARWAYASYLAGDNKQGARAIDALLKFPGTSLQAVEVLNAAGRYADALARAREAASPEMSFQEATALFHLAKYADAASVLMKAGGNRNVERTLLLGSAQALAGDLPAAVRTFQEAARLAPNDPQPYYRLSLVFMQGRRDEEAFEVLKAGLQQIPNSPLLWYAQGVVNEAAGKYEESIRCVQKSLKADAARPETWGLLGSLYNHAGEFDDAAKSYRKAMALAASPDIAVKYAELLIRQQQFSEAETVLQRLNANDAHVCRGLGKLYKAEKQYTRAEEYLRQAVALDPNDADAHFALGETFRHLKRLEEAKKEYAIASEKKFASESVRLLQQVN